MGQLRDPADLRSGRARKLAKLQKRYAWFGEKLETARAKGKIESDAVRFFITYVQPLLLDADGEPVLDEDGDPRFDWDAEPIYYGRAQAYSYVNAQGRCHPGHDLTRLKDPSTRTIAVQMDWVCQVTQPRYSAAVARRSRRDRPCR